MNCKTIKYNVEFYSDWHCGSGLASGAEADSVVIKDSSGLPFVPGKTLKGLINEAYIALFGDKLPSGMFFSNAEFSDALKKEIITEGLSSYLYRNVASVAMINGVSDKGSLRTIQVTIPCTLTATIRNIPADQHEKMQDALKYIKNLGYSRNRGLGRCNLKVMECIEEAKHNNGNVQTATNKLYFKCKLLSDVVLSSTSATSGPQSTLDFIPGSCFWGIVANGLYATAKDKSQEASEDIYDILYSGKCRFSDAHPAQGNLRSIRIPAAFYYEKDKDVFVKKGENSTVYVSHMVGKWPETLQPKQCRSGFVSVDMENRSIARINTSSTMTVKTAWSSETRSPQKSQLYTYESLDKGLELLFWVELSGEEDGKYAEQLVKYLTGTKKIGRSRSAQYGLVEIVQISAEECITPGTHDAHNDTYEVFADSRLIFLDSFGSPHFHPTAADLGFGSDAKVIWEKSQVRTFNYSSFNAHRGVHNSDYIGIEKGSVFVVESKSAPIGDSWVGSFQTEGFGHVIYNPVFFETENDGISNFHFVKLIDQKNTFLGSKDITDDEKSLVNWLEGAKKKYDVMSEIFKLNNSRRTYFNSSISSSQWGQIRQIAMTSNSYDELKERINQFITEGLRKEFWRGNAGNDISSYLDTEIVDICNDSCVNRDYFAPVAVRNLASVMIVKSKQSSKPNM